MEDVGLADLPLRKANTANGKQRLLADTKTGCDAMGSVEKPLVVQAKH